MVHANSREQVDASRLPAINPRDLDRLAKRQEEYNDLCSEKFERINFIIQINHDLADVYATNSHNKKVTRQLQKCMQDLTKGDSNGQRVKVDLPEYDFKEQDRSARKDRELIESPMNDIIDYILQQRAPADTVSESYADEMVVRVIEHCFKQDEDCLANSRSQRQWQSFAGATAKADPKGKGKRQVAGSDNNDPLANLLQARPSPACISSMASLMNRHPDFEVQHVREALPLLYADDETVRNFHESAEREWNTRGQAGAFNPVPFSESGMQTGAVAPKAFAKSAAGAVSGDWHEAAADAPIPPNVDTGRLLASLGISSTHQAFDPPATHQAIIDALLASYGINSARPTGAVTQLPPATRGDNAAALLASFGISPSPSPASAFPNTATGDWPATFANALQSRGFVMPRQEAQGRDAMDRHGASWGEMLWAERETQMPMDRHAASWQALQQHEQQQQRRQPQQQSSQAVGQQTISRQHVSSPQHAVEPELASIARAISSLVAAAATAPAGSADSSVSSLVAAAATAPAGALPVGLVVRGGPAAHAALGTPYSSHGSSGLPESQCSIDNLEMPAVMASGDLEVMPAAARRRAAAAAGRIPYIPHGVRTLIIRNMPPRLTQQRLLDMWACAGVYNYLHLPYTKVQGRTAGYCFINFVSREVMDEFVQTWQHQKLTESNRRVDIGVAKMQGWQANVEQWEESGKKDNLSIKKKHMPFIILASNEVADFEQFLDLTADQRMAVIAQEEEWSEAEEYDEEDEEVEESPDSGE